MASKIKVDNINKVSDDSNIINKCGTTIALGASGDSIALASDASQTHPTCLLYTSDAADE